MESSEWVFEGPFPAWPLEAWASPWAAGWSPDLPRSGSTPRRRRWPRCLPRRVTHRRPWWDDGRPALRRRTPGGLGESSVAISGHVTGGHALPAVDGHFDGVAHTSCLEPGVTWKRKSEWCLNHNCALAGWSRFPGTWSTGNQSQLPARER